MTHEHKLHGVIITGIYKVGISVDDIRLIFIDHNGCMIPRKVTKIDGVDNI